jgi:hypothetical protein
MKIDFVITWLDGNDPQWRTQKEAYYKSTRMHEIKGDDANAECRYRDMDSLRYWFRGVEKFAPWVNKVFFVTCGQKPEWLNENHPKLELVDHKDFIPAKYLPTFNARPIELNFHRIPSLSEHFVYFNDDMFLLRPITPALFFRENLPYLPCDMKINRLYGYNIWSKTMFNNYCVVNQNFNMREAIWKHRKKWFSFKNLGFMSAMMNLVCFRVNKRTDSKDYEHLPIPHLKSTFQEVWDRCPDIMDYASSFKFRSSEQVNQWLFCGWNQAEGKFVPARAYSRGAARSIETKNMNEICDIIKNQRYPQVCLNDSAATDNAEECFERIRRAFDSILPEKSSFEL